MLDGRDLLAAGSWWRVEVFGIVDEAGYRWLQLALLGPRRYVLTLRLDRHEGPLSALGALALCLTELASPSSSYAL